MPTYRVKPGHRFGVGKAKGPGDLVTMTTVEAGGFLDKLEVVEDEPESAVLTVVGGVVGDTSGTSPAPTPNDDSDADDTVPALDLSALWGAQAPGLNPRVVEVMLKHQLAPAVVAGMSDEALLALDGIGPSTLRALRELGA